ncbi:MAG: ubiquitin-conjugating enzyme E2 [Lautropia sp.]
MASAHQLRRQADVQRLHALAARSAGRLTVVSASPAPGTPIRVALTVRTVTGPQYRGAAEAAGAVALRIDLPARYPFERPVVVVESPVFHPNVFPNGTVCQGEKWVQSEGLDLLVMRIGRLLTWDAAHVNPASPANRTAANWYLARRASEPATFPTDLVSWEAERVVVRCPACGTGLRLPPGRRGVVACPACRRDVEVQT